jgi:hypothetical protein
MLECLLPLTTQFSGSWVTQILELIAVYLWLRAKRILKSHTCKVNKPMEVQYGDSEKWCISLSHEVEIQDSSTPRDELLYLVSSLLLNSDLWGYWHCGHSWPIVPASGDSEDDCVEKQLECRLAGETEVLGENLPQRHFFPSQNPTWPDPGLNPGRRCGKLATNRLSYGAS